MAVRDIVRLGDSRLWTPSRAVADFGSTSFLETVADMDDTLARFRADTGWGRGISAVQIGVPVRMTFVRLMPDRLAGTKGLSAEVQRSESSETWVFSNPRIVERSAETFDLWDDCFSFPNLLVRVKRNYRIAVRYEDGEGRPRDLEAEGPLSELLQHEFDHLDGILAIDRRIDDRSFRYQE